ncbi:hypothetical protein CPB86DRAFT_84106 [Serendipita vermifera]|nr:hypothetical protein CPB86DRAFT_84106 [Serendipita vermifera]
MLPRADGIVEFYDLSRLCKSPSKIIPSPEVSESPILDLAQNLQNLDFVIVLARGFAYRWQFSSQQVVQIYKISETYPSLLNCIALHPSGQGFVVGTEDGTLAFCNSVGAAPIWMITIPEIIAALDTEEDVSFNIKPVLKICWSISPESSKLITLEGGAGSTQLVVLDLLQQSLTFEEPPIINYGVIYNDPGVEIRDFSIVEEASQIMILTTTQEIRWISLPSETQVGAKKVLRLGKDNTSPSSSSQNLYLPMQIRPFIELYQITPISNEGFRILSRDDEEIKRGLTGGGIAKPAQNKKNPDIRLLKYEPSHLLAALYTDGIIRFDDISQKNLMLEDPLTLPYPNPLFYLSIDLKSLLDDPFLWASLNSAEGIKADKIAFLSTTLEVLVTLSTGEIIVWKHLSHPRDSSSYPSSASLVDLSSLEDRNSHFKPQFLFNCKEGPLRCFSACDAGFVAAAYDNGSVWVLNGSLGMFSHMSLWPSRQEEISFLRFAVCPIAENGHDELCLITGASSGAIRVLPLQRERAQSKRSSEPSDTLDVPGRKSIPNPIACYIIDLLDVRDKEASLENMARSREAQNQGTQTKSKSSSFAGHFYRLTVSNSQVRSDNGWNGKHITTIELGQIAESSLYHQSESLALIIYHESRSITILSVPQLETLTRINMNLTTSVSPTIYPFRGTGDFSILYPNSLEVWTLSSTRRIAEVDVIIGSMKPKPTSNVNIVTWLFGGAPMSPDEFDSMIAGPHRPPAPPLPEKKVDDSRIHNEAITALSERGELVDNLASQTEQLEHDAEGMAEQAKRLADRQSKRRTFGFLR